MKRITIYDIKAALDSDGVANSIAENSLNGGDFLAVTLNILDKRNKDKEYVVEFVDDGENIVANVVFESLTFVARVDALEFCNATNLALGAPTVYLDENDRVAAKRVIDPTCVAYERLNTFVDEILDGFVTIYREWRTFSDENIATSIFDKQTWYCDPARSPGTLKVLNLGGKPFRFRWIPSGGFTMGSPATERDRVEDETLHNVRLSEGFWLLETPVTQELWRAVYEAEKLKPTFEGPKRPVENVSWFDCVEFVDYLNRNSKAPRGFKFALPTEAQWEYASRAGGDGPYSGAYDLNEIAWRNESWFDGSTHDVGDKAPNAWNLYDMSGNVWEWCRDYYGDYPAGLTYDPTGPEEGTARVARGGAWYFRDGFCRSAYRRRLTPERQGADIGFRLALVPTEEAADDKTRTTRSIDEIFVEIFGPEKKPPFKSVPREKSDNSNFFGANDWEESDFRSPGTWRGLNIYGVEYRFRWLPSGGFTMAAPSPKGDRLEDEVEHKVTLTKGFWMMETPITQRLWRAVTGKEPSLFHGDDLPVDSITWDDASRFAEKLNALGLAPVGYRFALPTEAQWEYASRAGREGRFSGSEKIGEMGWYANNSGGRTREVAVKRPNHWGLYDMNGNVWEWCSDWYGPYDLKQTVDPQGPKEGFFRVMRGGAWSSHYGDCRSIRRGAQTPNFGHNKNGARLVLTPIVATTRENETDRAN